MPRFPLLANHADGARACDFIPAHDILFRRVHAFFIVHFGSRKVVHAATCRNPTREWTAQQLRNATMDGEAPKILLRDRDDKHEASLDRAAQDAGIRVIKTAVRAPTMRAIAESFVDSVRRELLDHVIELDDQLRSRLAGGYRHCCSEASPPQGIVQRVPERRPQAVGLKKPIVARPLLGGLPQDYGRAA